MIYITSHHPDIFSALGEPTRRHIIEMLASRGQLSATDIYSKFHVSHPAISQHLKILRKAKLVEVEKRAQHRFYQINPIGISELDSWVHQMKKNWTARFDRLDEVLAKEKSNLKKFNPRISRGRKDKPYGKS